MGSSTGGVTACETRLYLQVHPYQAQQADMGTPVFHQRIRRWTAEDGVHFTASTPSLSIRSCTTCRSNRQCRFRCCLMDMQQWDAKTVFEQRWPTNTGAPEIRPPHELASSRCSPRCWISLRSPWKLNSGRFGNRGRQSLNDIKN